MGATLSYLGYIKHQQPHAHGDATSLPIIELCTRLGALEKDLQNSRAENVEKDAVIRYLLHYCVTSFSKHSGPQAKDEVLTENLIDMLDCSQGSDSTKLTEEDTTLLDEFSEDQSETEEVQEATPVSSLKQSYTSEFEGSSYIFHFADAGTNFPEESSQLETLTSKRDDYESSNKSIARGSKVARAFPGLDTQEQAGPLVSTSRKLQNLPIEVDVSVIEPRWSMSEIFNSTRERDNAASLNRSYAGPNDLRYPDLFKYGIHFSPPDSERDVYRTIVVSNLSPDVDLSTVLDRVRGGSVIDAKLLDTIKITGKKTALIIFLHEYAAMAFEDYTKKNPVIINGVVARVSIVSTPTWPMRIALRKAIFDQHHTRRLKIFNFPKQISAHKFGTDINACMDMKHDRVTYMHKGTDGSVELHCSSVDWAGHAYGMLSTFKAYQDCTPLFSPDPCARPLETLEGERMACVAEAEMVTKNAAAPNAGSAAEDHSGRLAIIPW